MACPLLWYELPWKEYMEKLVEALVDRENNFAADSFYIMKLYSRLVFIVEIVRKNNKFRYLTPF